MTRLSGSPLCQVTAVILTQLTYSLPWCWSRRQGPEKRKKPVDCLQLPTIYTVYSCFCSAFFVDIRMTVKFAETYVLL